jgi:SAM-dependent methyltransferase
VEGTEVRKLVALEDRHWWYAERRRIVQTLVRRSFRYPRDRVALDIGAAGGGNTRVLRDAGFVAVPVDWGWEGASLAAERGLPAVRGDARHLPFQDACADLVVAFDVLEHIEDDLEALTDMARVLQPGGLLWIAVPSDMRLWSSHDTAVGHVRRYTRDQLTSRVRGAGLEVTDVGSWNVLLRPLVRVRRRRSTGSDLAEPGRVTNIALAGVVALERYLPLLRSAPGVSLMLTARRPTDSRS